MFASMHLLPLLSTLRPDGKSLKRRNESDAHFHFPTVLFASLVFVPLNLVPLNLTAQQSPQPEPASTTEQKARLDRADNATKLFALKVQPLFRQKCLPCHGEKPDEIEGGFDLRNRKSFLSGGDEFGTELVKPGESSFGHLLAMLAREESGFEMPPKEADRLTQEETWAVRDWIDGGAPWPDEKTVKKIYEKYAQGIKWQTSGGLSSQWTNRKYPEKSLWAYQPLWQAEPNYIDTTKNHPVDFFIDSKLAQRNIRSAKLASRRTLIRRATFDLLGLPPTPIQIQEFLSDPQDDNLAFSDLIDRLLASSHYGEQAARHWLDVVRYADSSGFANDWMRPNAWRYRDYVIRSFNRDKPYDDFVREQLAGDELAAQLAAPDPKQNPHAAELLIAAGFLRMGPWEHTGMSVARVTRQQYLDDITDSVGQVFLAHPLQCCRCHDHKFDPIPTRDYYSIQAVFATTQFAEIDTRWLPDENRSGMNDDQKILKQRIAGNQKLGQQISQRTRQYEKDWFKAKGLPFESVAQARKAKVTKKELPPAKYGWQADDFGQERVFRKWSKRLPWEMDTYRPIAFTVYNGKTVVKNSNQGRLLKPNPKGPGYWQSTSILNGGDVGSPGQKVSPGVLSAINLPKEIPVDFEGRRLAFANWLVAKENPIVSRVIVNRVWQTHFGRGIAGNPNNFGATGKHPTHPQLLDWLATEFMRNNWSIKKLHKLIMTSKAYRRSLNAINASELREKDPDNELYAVFNQRQLSAEEIRDSMLAVTGELNKQLGGIPAKPDMNLEAALQPRMIMGTFAPSYTPDVTPAQRNRRSIYVLRLRGQRDPFFELFNQPGPDKSCELRDQSMITPQALTLFNSDETLDRSLAFARKLLKNGQSDSEVINTMYQLAYGRNVKSGEMDSALEAWKEMTAIEQEIRYRPTKLPTKIQRRANEENTGQLFSFVEELFAYHQYQPDIQPHDVDAKTRGLSNLCLAIFNSNEFLFVD